MIGYILAGISSIFYAIYNVPKKLSKQKPMYYIVFMGISYFIVSLMFYIGNKIINPNTNETLLIPVLIFTAIRGVSWWAASLLLLMAIDKIGFGKANQWKILQSPIGTFLILVFLQEMLVTKLAFIIASAILMTLSAFLITVNKGDAKNTLVKDKRGIIYVIIATIFLGGNVFINKWTTNTGLVYAQTVYMSFFIMLSSIIYLFIKERSLKELLKFKERDNYLALIGGILYFFAGLLSTMAFKYILGSIGYIIINLQSVWTLLIGVFIFKEIDFKKNWLGLVAGILCAITAIVLLLFA